MQNVDSTHFCLGGENTQASGSPRLPFSMEKTDLDFIGLHTWKKFTPYA